MAEKKPLSPEVKALHKKFIPGNVIICIIALVAAISMILMPWLDLRIHIEGEKLAELLVEQNTLSTTDTKATTFAAYEEQSSSEEEILMNALSDSLRDESFDIPINLYPLNLLKVANGGEEEVEEFFNSVIGKNGAAEFLNDFLNKVVPVVVKASINTAIDQIFNEVGSELSEEEREMVDKYKGQVNSALDSIAENPSVENAKEQLHSVVDSIVADSGNEMSEEDVEEMRKVVDELVEQASKDGNFDYVHLVKNLNINSLEDALNGSTSITEPQPEPAPMVTVNGFAVKSVATPYEGADSGSSSDDNPLNAVLEVLENPGAMIADSLDDETVALLNLASWVILGVFIIFPVFLCLLLALCAFIRIFTEKKRVKYWYVSTILFISMLLLIGLNVLASVVLPSLNLGAEVGMIFSSFKVQFLGSSVVTSICWGVLTLFSLIFYRRIRKKIKLQLIKENTKKPAPQPQK